MKKFKTADNPADPEGSSIPPGDRCVKGDSLTLELLKKTGRKLIIAVLKRIIPLILPYLVPILALLGLFFFIYSILFIIPKTIVSEMEDGSQNIDGKVVAIFTTGDRDNWKLEDDQKLYKKYEEIDRNWLNLFMDQETLDHSQVQHAQGNAARKDAKVKEIWGGFYEMDSGIPCERAQVKQHRVSWGLLAAVDRVLGDPIITGLSERRPDPENHFKELEPHLKWEDFELYYRRSWTVDSGGDGVGREKMTQIYRHNIKLLVEVASYEAEKITYRWETKRFHHKDPNSDSTEEAVYPVLKDVIQQGPYFNRLRSLLVKNQLLKDTDLELVIHLAMNYDEEYKYNVSLISGNMAELLVNTEDAVFAGANNLGAYQWPTGGYTVVTSGFGWREHPVLGGLRFHKGIDIAVPGGTPVLAAWGGKVILSGWVAGYGKTVMIDHGGHRTLYAHLKSVDVNPGWEVRQGDIIGKSDSTGLSTGDHLHFEIRSGTGETHYRDPIDLYQGFSTKEDEQ